MSKYFITQIVGVTDKMASYGMSFVFSPMNKFPLTYGALQVLYCIVLYCPAASTRKV